LDNHTLKKLIWKKRINKILGMEMTRAHEYITPTDKICNNLSLGSLLTRDKIYKKLPLVYPLLLD
jgi:hypothetical protein